MNEVVTNFDELKPQFVMLWLKLKDPFAAALRVFPNDVALAMWAGTYWPLLPELIAEKSKLELSDTTSYLPQKKDLAEMILQKMQGHLSITDWRGLMRDYAEIMGFINKNGAQTNIQINNETKVIEVPVYADDSAWEAELSKNQKKLIIDAESKH